MCNVSIIVPNYNHSKFLRERLDSIFNQTYQDFEVILLDDCSTDNSVEILKEYANHPKVSHLEVNDQNSGSPFKQWQKGIALAKGDWIWIAESDDYSSEFFLEKITQNCSDVDAKDVGLIYCQSIDVDEQSVEKFDRVQYTKEFVPNIWEQNFIIDGKEFITNYLMHKNVIPNASAVVFKKSILGNVLEDDGILKMKMAGDWLFWISIIDNTTVRFINEALNYFRIHEKVTRNHTSRDKLLTRLLEEKKIRYELNRRYKLNQNKEWKIMYEKWFEINNFKSIFKSSFYLPKSKNTNAFSYLYDFVTYLINRK
jgi:glycosyltransferase involved in cell wall biosynthesis